MLPLSLPLHSNLFNMEQTRQEFRWPACLAVRENLLPSGVPYIPILIEDIFRYVSLIDYEQNCIKTVHTIGEILPDATRFARLRSISSHSDTEITLSLEKLPVHAVYFKDEKGRHLHIWVKLYKFCIYREANSMINGKFALASHHITMNNILYAVLCCNKSKQSSILFLFYSIISGLILLQYLLSRKRLVFSKFLVPWNGGKMKLC